MPPATLRLLLVWSSITSLCATFASSSDIYSPDIFDPLGDQDGATLEPSADSSACDVDEIQLASDGTIAQWGLALGTRVTPNMTVNGTVVPDGYNFYHLCVARHEHEHLITVRLLCDDDDVSKGGDANLYLSSDFKYPRMGQSTWISQHPGNELIKLYTYLDGFPRKDESGGADIRSRELFYTEQRRMDRKQKLRRGYAEN
ncbi:hypothetical protein BBJ29_000066 [Phytophthora kernoviae]|uniref:Uncharacterized protein n=1 Tax=Phytophthora kernoviae TaxID=325452 RepID=A0A3F2S3D6_9STRA|nr:hypothetical protein BBJ29_000066 [Phytophthora kernoviae]RLN68969.1 hypothetical protein BBP00_00000685 [Phytophthora kernoviae]